MMTVDSQTYDIAVPVKEDKIMRSYRWLTILSVFAFAAGILLITNNVLAATAGEINLEAKKALWKLYEKHPSAQTLADKAKGILVFPSIVKGGFMVGGNYGEGILFKGKETAGYYNTVQVSYGLQAGLQKYGYALFFMTDSAMNWLDKSDGWEVGVGPTITIIDTGKSGSFTTTTGQSDIYAFFFNQKGLMAGLGLQGTKITKIKK